MLRSFGIDTRPPSNRWNDVVRGPSKADVLAHIAKIARFAKDHRTDYAPIGSEFLTRARH